MAAETKSSTPRSARLPQWKVEKFGDEEWHILSTYEGQPVRIADVYDEADAHLAAEAPAMATILSTLTRRVGQNIMGEALCRVCSGATQHGRRCPIPKVEKILARVNRRRAA